MTHGNKNLAKGSTRTHVMALLAALIFTMPLAAFSTGTLNAYASAPPLIPVTFYLHDDGHGFGHPDKRYDWANTSTPYNPVSPYFISREYEGIELNSTGPMDSFRWMVWPPSEQEYTIAGNASVTLFMSESNTSTGRQISLNISLDAAASPDSSPTVLAATYLSLSTISPDEMVNASFDAGNLTVPAGYILELNVTRTDSNRNASVFVEFDYNSFPSALYLHVSERFTSLSLLLPSGNIYDSSINISVSSSDIFGAGDLASSYLTVTYTSNSSSLNFSLNRAVTGNYSVLFYRNIRLPYGNYTLTATVHSSENLSGSGFTEDEYASITVLPSLSYFDLLSPAQAQAGTRINITALAESDAGTFMVYFNAEANLTLAYVNGTPVTSFNALPINFSNGTAHASVTVLLSGEFVFMVSYGSRDGISNTIQISPGPVKSVEISPSNTSAVAGSTVHFHAYGYDAYGNMNTSWMPEWSLSGDVGSINATGSLIVMRAGNGTVTALDNVTGASAHAHISVSSSSLFLLTILPRNASVEAGQTYLFQALGFDSYGNPVPLHYVLWSTDAGNLSTNGSLAVLTAIRSTMEGAWIEAYSAGLTATTSINVTASAYSPVLVQLPEQTEPEMSSWSLNISPFLENTLSGEGLRWYLFGCGSLFTAYGEGVEGNSVIQFASGTESGYCNATLMLSNAEGYTASAVIEVHILPSPRWSAYFPSYLTLSADSYYSLPLSIFLNMSASQAGMLNVSTTVPYVYQSGASLEYFFPSSMAGRSVPVMITATNNYLISASVFQIVNITLQPMLSLNRRTPFPSVVSVDRWHSFSIPSPLASYFNYSGSMHFSIITNGVSYEMEDGILTIIASSPPPVVHANVLIEAETHTDMYAFLLLHVDIVSIEGPPSITQPPAIEVHYANEGEFNYAFPLSQYISDRYVLPQNLSIYSPTPYITFSPGNFSLLFALPANASGGSTYSAPYWANYTLLVVPEPGGPAYGVQLNIDVLVSDLYPPSVRTGMSFPGTLMMAENGGGVTLNVSAYLNEVYNFPTVFSVNSGDGIEASISSSGLLHIVPLTGFSGNTPLTLTVSSQSGILQLRTVAVVYPVYVEPGITLPSSISISGRTALIELSPFINVTGIQSLKIEAMGRGVQVAGEELFVSLPAGVTSEKVYLTFMPAEGPPVYREMTVTLSSHGQDLFMFYFYLPPVALAAAAAYALYHRRRYRFTLQSLTLVHSDGRLIVEVGDRGKSVDRDILAGMFSAVQEFVNSSFREEGSGLKRIEMNDFNLEVYRGRHLFLLVRYGGRAPSGFSRRMQQAVSMMDGDEELREWNGRAESAAAAHRQLLRLMKRYGRRRGT